MSLDPLLIKRFFRNECNEDERARVLAYWNEHPEELELYLDEAEWARFETEEEMQRNRAAKMKQQVMKAVRPQRRIQNIGYRKLAAAAAICLLASVSAYLWRQSRPAEQPAASLAAGDQMIVISNPAAAEKQVRMPDGSLVIMQAQSSIRYPGLFRQDRTVLLSGSALFDVAKDDKHPFRIKAGALKITVLGTRFMVDAAKQGKGTHVKLFSGRIRIGIPDADGKGTKEMDLSPGKEFYYQPGNWTIQSFTGDESRPATIPRAMPVKEITPLQGDALVFENRPLTEVLAVLRSHFNTPLRYREKAIRGYHFSGEFSDRDSLIQILNTICTLNGLQVKEDSTGYILSPAEK
jgi:ferric-dicitrate binding protein FerR (iron transport regulator)